MYIIQHFAYFPWLRALLLIVFVKYLIFEVMSCNFIFFNVSYLNVSINLLTKPFYIWNFS